MASVYRDHGVLIDPHSAVGVHAANLPQVRAALAAFALADDANFYRGGVLCASLHDS